MYLVDTSVWINLYRGIQTQATQNLSTLLKAERPYSVAGIIIQEVLQGAKTEQDYLALKSHISTQKICQPAHPFETYAEAAQIYYKCRRKGITIRSTIDCLIAQLAIENEIILLHDDHDFIEIAKVEQKLVLFDAEFTQKNS